MWPTKRVCDVRPRKGVFELPWSEKLYVAKVLKLQIQMKFGLRVVD